MEFQIKIEEEEDFLILSPIGELDIYHTPEFKEKALAAFNKKKTDIIIDGRKLEYMDSTGLGGFIFLLNHLQKNDKKIKMKYIKPNIMKLFTITKLDELFEFIGEDNE